MTDQQLVGWSRVEACESDPPITTNTIAGMIRQVYINPMTELDTELDKLEIELVRAKANMSDATVAALQEKLETVKSTLCDNVPDKDKVRWLRGFLGC